MRFAALAAALALVAGPAMAAELTLVRLNTFPTARSLPFFVGVEKGIFAKHGIKLEFEFTESSQAQREGLASGKFEVVHSAVDNALAMIEVAKVDVVIVSGGDGGTNEFIVGKGLKSYADIRGKALVTDAPNTAYALQAKKILARHGLQGRRRLPHQRGRRRPLPPQGDDGGRRQRRRDHEPAVLGAGDRSRHEEPWPHCRSARPVPGRRRVRAALLGKGKPDVLERYLAGYVESLRWVLDKANRDEAIAILMAKRNLSRSLATRSYDLMIEPGFGFNPDAKLNAEGFDNVLKLRQEVEGGPVPNPAKYLDLSYYDRAMKRLAR